MTYPAFILCAGILLAVLLFGIPAAILSITYTCIFNPNTTEQ